MSQKNRESDPFEGAFEGAPAAFELLVRARALLVLGLRCYHASIERREAAERAFEAAASGKREKAKTLAMLRAAERQATSFEGKLAASRAAVRAEHGEQAASIAFAERLLGLERARHDEMVWAGRVDRAAGYVARAATEWQSEQAAEEHGEQTTGIARRGPWVPTSMRGDAWEPEE